MANERFKRLVADAKARIAEVSPVEAAEAARGGALLIDVRTKDDFAEAHAAGAQHLSRDMIEVEIEDIAPDPATPILCYCGGGSRSALATESLQKMGYTNVKSVAGGFRAWAEAGLPVEPAS
jgi:rhodanese-related sulfurtransferase